MGLKCLDTYEFITTALTTLDARPVRRNTLTGIAFVGEKVLEDLFVSYSSHPIGAAVEWLFSIDVDEDVFVAEAAALSVSHAIFDRLMFMKGIQHHIGAVEKEQ